MNPSNHFPPPGPCALKVLPDPYQTAFRQGSAHHLPGQFLPAQIDFWFTALFIVPFTLLYASPILIFVPSFIYWAIWKPEVYPQFFQKVFQQSLPDLGLTLLLLALATGLIILITYQAWDMAQLTYRTWHADRIRKQGGQAYGLVLLSQGIVGRLINKVEGHNCLWLPRQAVIEVAWHRMWEEGTKRSRWVHRTRVCYQTEKGTHHWLTLKGTLLQLGDGVNYQASDRALYDWLFDWWKQPQA